MRQDFLSVHRCSIFEMELMTGAGTEKWKSARCLENFTNPVCLGEAASLEWVGSSQEQGVSHCLVHMVSQGSG